MKGASGWGLSVWVESDVKQRCNRKIIIIMMMKMMKIMSSIANHATTTKKAISN